MRNHISALRIGVFFLLTSLSISARVLDDFNDNSKTGWTDFTFIPGFGVPSEAEGLFRFEQPPAGDPIFSATQKTSESFELIEGRTIEFRVDIVETGGKDSFAVLGWMPTENSAGELKGYGLSKSRTDVLISKGINRYFVIEGWPPETRLDAPSDNVTLVLTLTARDGNVHIKGQVLDKSNDNAVLWEQTAIDTPSADVVVPEGDEPIAPFLNQSGYFTLYLYQDFDDGAPENPYYVVYDNAEVRVIDRVVVDDFNDNNKSGWTDFTFVPGFGIPSETEGQFRFEQPPAGDPIFSASQKTSRQFELKDGEELELQVDVESSGGKDSFAVLAWLPVEHAASSLSGYGLSKSTTDVLISKGIEQYFVVEGWPPSTGSGANESITMSLNLRAGNGSVTITGKIIDKADGSVIWERSAVDTPSADVLVPNGEEPIAPFLGSGYFTLYLYQDFDSGAPENPYMIYFDNAIVLTSPETANKAPIITAPEPAPFSAFVDAESDISFQVADDSNLPETGFKITVNGTAYTPANGLSVTGPATARSVSLSDALDPDETYVVMIEVLDADGASSSQTIYFDTFDPNHFVIEVEDYNFDGGSFLDNPVLSEELSFFYDPVPGSYRNQYGYEALDFHENRTSPDTDESPYRANDSVRMARTLDFPRAKYVEAGGSEAMIFDYDVTDIASGEWLNYTRTFPAGTYEVYLRQSVVNETLAESTLELVTSDRTQPDQTTTVLGTFHGPRSGYQYRSVPLTDATGLNKVVVELDGETTLRLRQHSTDPDEGVGIRQNYLLFVPAEGGAGTQRARFASISPAPNSATTTLQPAIRVEIENRETSLKAGSIVLEVNGKVVEPSIATEGLNGAVVTYPLDPLPAPGAMNTARIRFLDNEEEEITAEWGFRINYLALSAANRRTGTGNEPGFNVRLVQARMENGAQEDSLSRAEAQLAANSSIPKFVDVTEVYPVINLNETEGAGDGYFTDDLQVPGLQPEVNGTDDFAVEITAYLELPAGIHSFGARTDDGYKITSGQSLTDTTGIALGFLNDNPADHTFSFYVPEPGLYPFRMVWYERSGLSLAEWFSVNPETEERVLINDPNVEGSIKAYVSITGPALSVEVSETVDGDYAIDNSAVIDTNSKTITIPLQTGNQFYRLSGTGSTEITGAQISGSNLLLTYE